MNDLIYVYIAGPLTKGDYILNVRKAIEAWDQLSQLGFIPFNPHLSAFSHLVLGDNGLYTYDFWLTHDFAWLARCDCLLRLPGESYGADCEVAEAHRTFKPVFTSIEDLVAWRNENLA